MNQQRQDFVAELAELACKRLWPQWHTVRQVYADWLEEQECYLQAALARANWQYVRTTLTATFTEHWTVRPLDPRQAFCPKMLTGCVNRYPVLHFQPRRLLLRRWLPQPDDGQWLLHFRYSQFEQNGPIDADRHVSCFFGLFQGVKEFDHAHRSRLEPHRLRFRTVGELLDQRLPDAPIRTLEQLEATA